MHDADASRRQAREVCADCEARVCERHCSAANKNPEDYGPWCGMRKGQRTNHEGAGPCYLHMGRTAAVEKSARRQLAQKALAVHLRDLTYEPLGDPVVELADVAAKWRTLADWATSHAAEVEGEATSTWLAMALDLGKEARRALADCGRLGLEERRVRLEEAQLELAAAVLLGTLRRLGHDPDAPAVQAALEATYRELGGPA